MLTVGNNSAGVEELLVNGRLSCPGCGGRLGGWGHAVRRRVFSAGRVPVAVRPRRARCAGCGATHVLLPAWLLSRRCDVTSVIGDMLVRAAQGQGFRGIAAATGVPEDTVRGRLRRALALAQHIGYRLGEVISLGTLSFVTWSSDDMDHAVQLARQAAQLTDGVAGGYVRWCSYVLTGALIAAGDLAGADDACAAGLARCRDAGDVVNQWNLLPYMVLLDVHAGRLGDAAAHLREGLQLAARTGAWLTLVTCLDCCGFLCAETGRPAEAVTVWAANATLWRQMGGVNAPAEVRLRDQPLRAARQALGPDRTRAAEERGTAMSLAAAAEYALMLTEDPGPTQAPAAGLGRLSARERELVTLVARGRTDTQIAAELFISVRTVSSHLERIRDKTGCRRRADLTRLALAAGLV